MALFWSPVLGGGLSDWDGSHGAFLSIGLIPVFRTLIDSVNYEITKAVFQLVLFLPLICYRIASEKNSSVISTFLLGSEHDRR